MQRNSDGRLGGGERRGEHKSRCIDTAKGMLAYKRAVKRGEERRVVLYPARKCVGKTGGRQGLLCTVRRR